MRRTTTLTALLLGATLLAPTGAATAVGETCRGEAATIVGIGPSIVGTEGRDVIVSGTASTVDALAGDDLVCLTGTDVDYFSIRVDAGSGADLVDATATTAVQTRADLGAGADTFYGGPQSAAE